jgi:peroxiredoxin-like protein
MSDETHHFHLSSDWTENSDGDGVLAFDWGGKFEYGVPALFGGKEGRTNPEELLIASVISCYSITLSLLIEKRRLTPAPRIEVSAEGTVIRNPDRTLTFQSITLKPKISARHFDDAEQQKILELAQKADHYCLISKALRGNVEMSVDAEII